MSLETTNLLKQSFFANRILETIEKDGMLDKSKRELFERILEYINTVKNGDKELESGSLMENPFESIKAYKNAYLIMTLIPCDEKKNKIFLNKLLEEIKTEVNSTLSKKRIDPERLKKTKEYFAEAYSLATQESSQELMNLQENDNWQIHSLS